MSQLNLLNSRELLLIRLGLRHAAAQATDHEERAEVWALLERMGNDVAAIAATADDVDLVGKLVE